jgi:high-affinity iron transporter
MIASFLLMFREGLEAALIAGILFGYLNQTGHADRRRWVWAAIFSASALSLALAVLLNTIGTHLEGRAEAAFEGLAMLLAVGVLTWMIVWMRRQARYLKTALQAELGVALRSGHNWGLFGVAFLAVFREGVEMALFLTALSLVNDGWATISGVALGLVAATVTGWAIYSSTARLDVRRFFDVTSVLLLIFAAGLLAHGLHELAEIGWLPELVEQVWTLRPVLSHDSTGGAILRTLVGYNDSPSLLEMIGYLGYWVIVLLALNRWIDRPANRRPVTSQA